MKFSSKLFIFLIRLYQGAFPAVKPLLGIQGQCRYFPSCSQFTIQAIAERGPLRGSWAGFKRILSCRP